MQNIMGYVCERKGLVTLCFISFPQCSVTCGQGYQLRAVKCIMGTYMSVVDDNDCNAATRPTDTQVRLLFQLRYWLWAVKAKISLVQTKRKHFHREIQRQKSWGIKLSGNYFLFSFPFRIQPPFFRLCAACVCVRTHACVRV